MTRRRLMETLDYDPETGVFTWRVDRTNRIKAGSVAGHVGRDGYRRIMIDGKLYYAHRLAWLFVYGYFSENSIDHRNRIRDANWIKNLREVSQVCNARNCELSRNNRSGANGVFWNEAKGKWQAQICVLGKRIHLGYFEAKIEAVRARWGAEVEHGFPTCNTTSSALQYIKNNQPERSAL